MPPKPITSVADFARVLRDDIIPLIEEYCYEDFSTLKDILGGALVDVQAGRIQDEMFEPNREADLVQAVSFEEMQPFVLVELAEGVLAANASDDGADDEEREDALDAAS